MTIEELAENLLKRRIEIDAEISRSLYSPHIPEENDVPPTGYEYNDLFDAISDELRAALGDGPFNALYTRLVAEERNQRTVRSR
ncbi:MAG: hypothetical protein KGL39_03590 [Patescibacteria group bacterium]|nr:hypothetical protein [Patescibacteria group bacterium]